MAAKKPNVDKSVHLSNVTINGVGGDEENTRALCMLAEAARENAHALQKIAEAFGVRPAESIGIKVEQAKD